MKKSNILAIGATVLLLAGCGNGKSSDVSKKAGGKYAAKQELNWTESNTIRWQRLICQKQRIP